MATSIPAQRERAGRTGFWFFVLVCLVFCGEGLAYVAGLLTEARSPDVTSWGAVALIVGGAGTLLLDRLLLQPHRRLVAELGELKQQNVAGQQAQAQLAGGAEQQRRLRHDIRGALSPALLTADRLINHADPAVKRAADIMVRSVDRAAALLADPADSGANPLAGP